MAVDFEDLLTRFTHAVESGDGDALAAVFTPDGVYHDNFYGAFEGHDAIRDMLEGLFHRDAEKFLWDTFDPVFNGRIGYASWMFSYTSRMADSTGRRVVFEGMSCFTTEDGLIKAYDEVFSAGVALVQLGMDSGRMEKILHRQAQRTLDKATARRHIEGP